jgi:hypothetical protein
MVLLKNNGGILPYPVGKTVAVIGVSSNSSSDILGNYVGPMCADGKYDCVPTSACPR